MTSASASFRHVGQMLTDMAQQRPNAIAVAQPLGRAADGRIKYRTVTFRELDDDSTRIARNLLAWGVKPGLRIVLMVPQSIDFISLVFALLKAGVVVVLIDPGMGRQNILKCLVEVEPEGFVAIPLVHWLLLAMPGKFPRAKWNVTLGWRWLWGGKTLAQLREPSPQPPELPQLTADHQAAIIFTTGSTGPPKGVLYRHGNFARQVTEIRDRYGIAPGEIDVAGFPLFALFDAAMGVTLVIPDMDPTRPADVKPDNIIDAVHQWQATQAFGSPALWNRVGTYCESRGIQLPSLRRVLSAGAPVPVPVVRTMKKIIANNGEIYTPYGATEALPLASMAGSDILGSTAMQTASGAGTCVGNRFPGIAWKVIRITDAPLPSINVVEELPRGEIGELMVRGEVVTREYITRTEANALHKVLDGDTVWHRMGDVGYLDDQDRFWFCGRKSHRVQTEQGVLFTEQCEAIFNQHARVYRTALIGVGSPGSQTPGIVVEPLSEHWPATITAKLELANELREIARTHEYTKSIHHYWFLQKLPVDIRHNSKIFREKLVVWATAHFNESIMADEE